MKTVSVLLCLALAHGIAANILYPELGDFETQEEKLIKYLRQHRNQPNHSLRDTQHKSQQQNLEWRQTDEPQHKDQMQHSQGKQDQYYEPSSSTMKYNPSSTQQPQEQKREQDSVLYLRNQDTDPRSASSVSSQNSQESREKNPEQDKSQLLIKNHRWIRQDSAESIEKQNTARGDVMVRKVVQITGIQDNKELEKIFGEAKNAMQHLTVEEKKQFHEALELAQQQNYEQNELNATQMLEKYQYPVEEHTVKTDDGYVLTLFRIPPIMQLQKKRPVVFLMHGLDGSADDWLLMGPQRSLAYLLSDAGYDVWLGNARGNKYSKQHVSKHPAYFDFWQYSIDEIASQDLPAMIDYTLETTEQEKMYYIGHSQGNTAFFALTAAHPEYNDKIKMMYALSPMFYMNNVRSPLLRMISPLSKFHKQLQHQLGSGPFVPKKEFIRTVGGSMLEEETGCKEVSSNVVFVMAGVNLDVSDAPLTSVVMHHLPAGTSSKVIKHYGQAVASQEFRRYDYGPKMNLQIYGMEQPPKYDMFRVRAPVTLYYSEEDWLAHPKDVERLEMKLPNVRESHKVSDEHFGNMDFQFSFKAPELVYRQLIDSMQNYQ